MMSPDHESRDLENVKCDLFAHMLLYCEIVTSIVVLRFLVVGLDEDIKYLNYQPGVFWMNSDRMMLT